MAERVRSYIVLAALLSCCGTARAQNDGALARAIRADDAGAVQAALSRRADPDQRLAFGATPLSLAIDVQDPALVAALLAKGAQPNIAGTDGVTPLNLAC